MTEKPFRRLPSYAGPITPQQAAQGIQAAVQNARSLLADAELLCEHSRWPRVASLSILAAEEIGKVSLLREILVAETPEQLREMWRDYRRHTEKNWLGVFLSCVSEAPNIEDFRELADPESDHRQLLEALKQLGLYSDCLGQCHWCLPDRAIDEQEARVLFLLGWLNLHQSRPQKALSYLHDLTERYPGTSFAEKATELIKRIEKI